MTQLSVQSPLVQAHLLGAFTLRRGDSSVSLPAAVRTLLAYLLLHRERPQVRTALLGLFWPEAPEERARRALRQTLWHLHRHLPGFVQADHETIKITPQLPLWVDANAFEALVTMPGPEQAGRLTALADLKQAVQLYRGDLLEGVYDNWVLLERERLRGLYCQALERIVQIEKTEGRYETALQFALTLTTADPLHEAAHRDVMRLYALLGRPEAALNQLTICRRLLKIELDLELEPETVALAEAIARRSDGRAPGPALREALVPSRANTHSFQAVFVGRTAERASLLWQVQRVFSGAGGVMLVEGEAGVGKSELLREVSQDAEWRGAQVLWGKQHEVDTGAPYAVLVDALSAGLSPLRVGQLAQMVEGRWLRALKPLLPSLEGPFPDYSAVAGSADAAQERLRLVEAVGHLLVGWAQLMPLVLVLDDLQWVDEETWDILAHLARRLRDHAVLVIGLYRGEDVRARPAIWEKLQELDRAGVRARLVLGRLSAEAVSELIRHGLGLTQPASRFEARLYRETDGNPLFVWEMLHTLYEKRLVWRDEQGQWHLPWEDDLPAAPAETPLSPAIERMIAQRLATLTAPLRQTLNAAAVLGNLITPKLLSAVSGLAPQDTFEMARELVQRHFLLETAEEYRFHHDKVRQVVYEEMSPAEQARRHRCAAEAMQETHPRQVDALAYHFHRGEVWGRAVHYAQLAGERALAVQAYPTAVEHFTTALSIADQAGLTPEAHFDLWSRREGALEVLGRRDEQAADLEEMAHLVHSDPGRQVKVRQRQALLLNSLSRFDDAAAAAHEAFDLAQCSGDRSAQANALIILGQTFCSRSQFELALTPMRAALDLVLGLGDLPLEARTRLTLATVLRNLSEDLAARAEAEVALRLYEQLNHPVGQCDALHLLGAICGDLGLLEAWLQHQQQALEIARALGYRYSETVNLICLGITHHRVGQVAEARQCLALACRLCQVIGNARLEAWSRMTATDIQVYLGDYEGARQEIEPALAYARRIGDAHIEGNCLLILAGIARRLGDWDQAHQHLAAACLALGTAAMPRVRPVLCLESAALSLAMGKPDVAHDYITEAETLCRASGGYTLVLSILAQKSLILLALGQADAALASSTQAMSQYKPGCVDQDCCIPWAHSQALEACGRPAEARAALELAYERLMNWLKGSSPQQQRQSLERVPEHRAIAAAWAALQPTRETLRLPRADAPLGRPLHENEWVEVLWTVNTPEDDEVPDKVMRRHQRLLRLIHEAASQGAAPTYEQLARTLKVSWRTIAHDMSVLRQLHPGLPSTRRKIA